MDEVAHPVVKLQGVAIQYNLAVFEDDRDGGFLDKYRSTNGTTIARLFVSSLTCCSSLSGQMI